MSKVKKAKKKEKKFPMLGRSVHDCLYRAVVNYVEARGGNVVVIGGIQVQEWDASNYRFSIAVQCCGRKPTFKSKAPR